MNDFAGWFYECGSALCHQLPDRSFFLLNTYLPVCARCTGVYSGALIGIFWMWLKYGFRGRYEFSGSFTAFLALSELYLLTDWWIDWPSNLLRLTSGFIGGWAAALGGVSSLSFLLWKPEAQVIKSFSYRPVLAAIIILSINAVFIILPSLERITLMALWTMITLGVIGLYSVANTVIALLVFDNLRRRAYNLKYFIKILAAGLLMFVIEFTAVFNF